MFGCEENLRTNFIARKQDTREREESLTIISYPGSSPKALFFRHLTAFQSSILKNKPFKQRIQGYLRSKLQQPYI